MPSKLTSKALRHTADLRKRFVAPDARFQSRRKISGSVAAGSVELGWYRGHHEGLYDSYKALRRKYPEAAKVLLEKFGMNPNGTLQF